MKKVAFQDHYDGHGLADTIHVYADDRDPDAGNASHNYVVLMDGVDGEVPGSHHLIPAKGFEVARIAFQHGPRDEDYAVPGLLDSTLLTVLLDRYRGFQSGPFACRENAIVITHLETANLWMKKRADDRARRGVLGKNIK